jgi:teichuronic acid exporter
MTMPHDPPAVPHRNGTGTGQIDNAGGLDHSLVSGMAWTAALRWFSQVISWAGTFYAARLLKPADYGLVAMGMLAIGLARMVEDFGMDAILVQDRAIVGHTQARLAGLLLALGLALCAVFALAAQPISWFFNEPKVAWMVVALSAVFVTDALQVVPRAQLQRDLQFRRLGLVQLVQVFATQLTLVIAVSFGLGHWSLVVNTLAGAVAVTILLCVWSPFSLRWPGELASLVNPLKQGWRILASRAAWYGYSNADQTIIGKMLGPDALGAYSFAATFSTLAQQEVGSIVSRVVPGIFSEVQNRVDELRRYFLMLTELLAVVAFPLSIGLALLADLLIPALLGAKWNAAISPLQLLCLYSTFLSSQLLLSHVLMWTGQFRANMWCTLLTCATMPLVFLFAVRDGVVGIAWAWAAVFPIVNIPQFFYAFRTINIRVADWLNALSPAIAGCLVMSLAIFALRWALPATVPLPVKCAALIALGALVYPAVIWLGFRARAMRFIELAKTLRGGGAPATARPA